MKRWPEGLIFERRAAYRLVIQIDEQGRRCVR
jgi:hypothetical protein